MTTMPMTMPAAPRALGLARLALAMLLLLMTSLAYAQREIVVRDDLGVEHRLSAPPRRIVSMLPSLTEMVWVIGAGSQLVGVDRYSDWPPEIERLPRLGGLDDAQIEAIAALQPDLVLGSLSARSLERLQALGLRVVRFRSETHADVQRTLRLVARLLGKEEVGVRAWERVERELDAAAARVPAALHGARVYFEIGGGPYAAGTSSFVGQTLARLGLVNIVPAELGPFPKLNPEFVVRAQPQAVMGVQRELASLAQRPGWGAIPAVQSGWLCGFESPRYEMLIRPGPRLGEAAEALVDCLQRLPHTPRSSAGKDSR
ncbi:MAG TPA: helical backbone metal receptor [Rubrivivax sp.]|nr:helical backbone metal receptor [Burkholderiales bacterium]HNU11229.1 helical backbone metal receptor [Rubrivivax sp.]